MLYKGSCHEIPQLALLFRLLLRWRLFSLHCALNDWMAFFKVSFDRVHFPILSSMHLISMHLHCHEEEQKYYGNIGSCSSSFRRTKLYSLVIKVVMHYPSVFFCFFA
ncbi:hypothetical protein CHARACLAT_026431 [Characodon lateralis]|uniref:Uncharacterized protein n=1 Tax=Characodon lateralis TaxID=208331 RepID=A0ABU7DWH3_9TELE|nr:hypothetical protein [Characodon lateralis]